MKKYIFSLIIWLVGFIGIVFSATILYREELKGYLNILSVLRWSASMTLFCLCFFIGEINYMYYVCSKKIVIVLLLQIIISIIVIVLTYEYFVINTNFWESLKFITSMKIGGTLLASSIVSISIFNRKISKY